MSFWSETHHRCDEAIESLQSVIQIFPLWVQAVYKSDLFRSKKIFECLFASDSTPHIIIRFIIYEFMNRVLCCKDRSKPLLVLPNPTREIIGYANIEHAMAAVCKKVYAVISLLHNKHHKLSL